MTRPIMTRLIVTLVLLAAFGREAVAQEALPSAPPRLRELVTVTADVVRVGDLVENAGAAAGVAVFRAPDLGQTGTVQVARVTEALRPHDIAGLDTAGLSEIVVTRLSRVITTKEIEERIAGALAGQNGFRDSRSLSVAFDRGVRSIHVEASVTAELGISRMNVEPRTGRFDVLFEIPGSAVARRLPLRFTGTVMETVETVTLMRTLARGDTIRDSDVVIERRPRSEVAGDAIGADQAIGLSAKRPLRSGQVLRPSDLMKADVIQRNETVTILFETPGILLTVRGKALENGAVGEMINVLNVQSNRTVQAAVTGPGRVTIAATRPRVAAATAPASDDPEPRHAQ